MAKSRRAIVVGACAVVGVIVLGVVVSRHPRVRRGLQAGRARWHEMNTADTGRERILSPDVLGVVAALKGAQWAHYRFSSGLENEVTIAPYIVEASWPIACGLVDDNVVGYLDELRNIPSCTVVGRSGGLALARCHN